MVVATTARNSERSEMSYWIFIARGETGTHGARELAILMVALIQACVLV